MQEPSTPRRQSWQGPGAAVCPSRVGCGTAEGGPSTGHTWLCLSLPPQTQQSRMGASFSVSHIRLCPSPSATSSEFQLPLCKRGHHSSSVLLSTQRRLQQCLLWPSPSASLAETTGIFRGKLLTQELCLLQASPVLRA